MRHWAALVTVGVLLAVTASLAVSPVAIAASPHPYPSAAGTAAKVSATVSTNSVFVGSNVQLTLTVSDFNASCGYGSLNWQLANGASFLNPESETITGNGTFTYVWTSQAPTGTWNFTGALLSQGTAGCAVATSNVESIFVMSEPGGGLPIPPWLYQFLADTYHAAVTALDQGIAAPIASVLGTIADAFSQLVAPWGSALASLGIFGPVGLVAAVLAMAGAVYGVLAEVGAAKAMLGY